MAAAASAASAAAAAGGEVVEAVSLPPLVEELLGGAGTRWTILQVDRSLDWKTLLSKALLKVPADGPITLEKTGSYQVAVKLVEDPWSQFVPLQPSGDDGKLLPSAAPLWRIVQVTRAPENRAEVDEHVRALEEAAQAAERRRQAGAQKQKQLMMEQRRKALARFGVPAISAALQQVGFDLDGVGDDGEDADGAPEEDQSVPTIHLRPLPDEELKGGRLLLAFWGIAPMSRSRVSQLGFRSVREPKRSAKFTRLVGKMKGAKHQELVGVRTKASRGKYVTLLGIQQAGSKRIFFHEAEVYHVGPKRQPSVALDQEKKGYGELKGQLVENMGTVAKQRQSRLAAAKAKRDFKVESFGDYNKEAAKRAQELRSTLVSTEERDAELKAKLLPPFNPEATEPRGVYRDGLSAIASEEMIKAERSLLKSEMLKFLKLPAVEQVKAIVAFLGRPQRARKRQKKSNKPADDEEAEDSDEEEDGQALAGVESRFVLSVLLARARAEPVLDEEELRAVTRQIGVLNSLATLMIRGMKYRGGKLLAAGVAELLGFSEDSRLAVHWHQELFEDILGKNKLRTLNGRKVLCYLIVWALHLTPDLTLEIQASIARDLHVQPPHLRTALQSVGCTITEKKQPQSASGIDAGGKLLQARLEGPPRYNRAHYEGKGSGRGKKRPR